MACRIVQGGRGDVQEGSRGFGRGAAAPRQQVGHQGVDPERLAQGGDQRRHPDRRSASVCATFDSDTAAASLASAPRATGSLAADAPLVDQRRGHEPGGVGADDDPDQEGEREIVQHLSAEEEQRQRPPAGW